MAARVTSCCLESKAGCRLQTKITNERNQDTVFFFASLGLLICKQKCTGESHTVLLCMDGVEGRGGWVSGD